MWFCVCVVLCVCPLSFLLYLSLSLSSSPLSFLPLFLSSFLLLILPLSFLLSIDLEVLREDAHARWQERGPGGVDQLLAGSGARRCLLNADPDNEPLALRAHPTHRDGVLLTLRLPDHRALAEDVCLSQLTS